MQVFVDIFKEILETIDHPIIVVSASGKILYANPATYEIFMPFTSLEGKSIDVIDEKAVLRDIVCEVVEKGFAIKSSISLSVKRQSFEFLVDAFPFHAEDKAVVLVLKDVSQKILIEEIRKKEERLKVLEHTINNLLLKIRPIVAGLVAVSDVLDDDMEARDFVKREIIRLNSFIEETYEFSRDLNLVKKKVSIHQLIDEGIDVLRQEIAAKNLKIKRIYDPSIPDINADPIKLYKAFLNILKNAVEATEFGKEIIVETYIAMEKKLDPNAFTVAVAIRNPHDRLPRDMEEKLFMPFITSKSGHTGIGLAMAYKIVKEHRGEIEYNWRDGYVEFLILIPAGRE